MRTRECAALLTKAAKQARAMNPGDDQSEFLGGIETLESCLRDALRVPVTVTPPFLGDGPQIGGSVFFVAVYEDGTEVQSRGTVADIRDGSVWAFVLGQRWPFEIPLDQTPGRELRGYYPKTEVLV